MSDPRQPNNPTEAAQLARVAARDFEGFKRALLANVQLYADIQAGRTCMGSPVLAENVLAEIANEVDLLVRAVAPAGAEPTKAMIEAAYTTLRGALNHQGDYARVEQALRAALRAAAPPQEEP